MMEKKPRTNTGDSSPPSQEEAAASLDPLVQPINAQDSEPIYARRKSSIFYVPASTIHENNEEQSGRIKRCFTYLERFSGIFYALSASFLFTCSNFVLKQLNINILDVLLIRCFIQALISIGFIIYKGYRLFPDSHRTLIFIRSLFSAAGAIAFFYCLSLLPLPDLTTLRYTQVVWTALLAMIIFRERINIPTIIACMLTLIGVACVAQPSFLFPPAKIFNKTFSETIETKNEQRFVGMLVALSCALSISMSIVLNKKLIQYKVQQSLIILYFILTTLVLLLFHRIHYWIFSQSNDQELHFSKVFFTKDFLLALMIAVSQLIPMILAQTALKREHPSIITVVQSSDILFALVLQDIFDSIKTNFLVFIGSILVLTSIVIVGGHKLWLDRRNRTCLPQENMFHVEAKK